MELNTYPNPQLMQDVEVASNDMQSDSPMVQISADALSSLITSVNGMQQTISRLFDQNAGLQKELEDIKKASGDQNASLQQELQNVKHGLQILLQNSGAWFPLFSRLPSEIRRYVCLMCLQERRITSF